MKTLPESRNVPNIHSMLFRNTKPYSFLVVFLALFATHAFFDITHYPYDSGAYWNLSDPANIANFPNNVRGYFYPYVLLPIHFFTEMFGDSGRVLFRLSTSAVYSYLLTGPVANFFLQCFGGRLTIIRRTLFALLAIAVFPGLFLYPLSDMPAAIALIIAVVFADSANRKHWLVFLFFSGAAASAAYNIRTIYFFGFLALLVVIPLFFLRSRQWKDRGLGLIGFILGAFIIALPQMAINKRIHQVASPLVFATVNGNSLMGTQLYWGVTIQRYETYNGGDAPAASAYYKDPAGIALRSANESLFTDNPTILGYMSLVSENPIQFLGIYGRHFINGIDIRDGLVYVTKSSTDKNIIAVLCFSVFFFSALVFSTTKHRWSEVAYLAPLLLPVLAIIPGAIETRFFMPLYLVLFGLIATKFEWPSFLTIFRKYWLPILVAYILLIFSFLAVTTTAMAFLSYSQP